MEPFSTNERVIGSMPIRSLRPGMVFNRAKQFEELIRPHVEALYAAAYRLHGNKEDAVDLVQEVLTKIYPRLQEMRQLRDLRPWLLRVLYNQFVDQTRQRRRMPTTVSDEELLSSMEGHAPGPEQLSVAADLSDKLVAALAQLDVAHRSLVVLHLQAGYTLEELTEVFSVPLGTLKSRLHRARSQLKQLLLPVLGDGTFFND